MILVVSLLEYKNSLHHYEFVKPIADAVRSCDIEPRVVHYMDVNGALEDYSGIILCGSALGDNAVLEDRENFGWLKTFGRPIMGICVGANLLSLLHGGDVNECVEIGMVKLSAKEDDLLGDLDGEEGYALHTLAPVPPPNFEVLSRSSSCIHAFKSRVESVYGVLFHPEVRHLDILERFCSMCR